MFNIGKIKGLTLNGSLARQVVLEQILALMALEQSPLRIAGAVMPRYRALLNLNVATRRALPIPQKIQHTFASPTTTVKLTSV